MFKTTTASMLLVALMSLAALDAGDPEAAENRETFSELAQILVKADRLEVYEGLPHPKAEKDLFEAEKTSKATIERHDFLFYKEPLSIESKLAKTLYSLSLNTKTLKAHSPGFCGGFHPDYALVFHTGDKTIEVHICFGCGEIKFFGEGKVAVFSLSSSAKKQWRKLLTPLRKNRPEPKVDGIFSK